MNCKQLRERCKELKIRGYSKFNKAELESAIYIKSISNWYDDIIRGVDGRESKQAARTRARCACAVVIQAIMAGNVRHEDLFQLREESATGTHDDIIMDSITIEPEEVDIDEEIISLNSNETNIS